METNTESKEILTDRSLAIRQAAQILTGERGLKLTNYEEMYRFAKAVSQSKFKPVADWSEVDCFICLQKGAEVGMSPMQSLESIYIVNNRATLFGDAPKGLIEASGLMLDYDQYEEGKPFEDDYKWVVTSLRKGRSKPLTTTYSVADAKLAGLWEKRSKEGKPTPWITAPKRMLLFRARGFNLRDNFSDILKGFTIGELIDDGALEGFENAKAATAKIVEPNFGGQESPASVARSEVAGSSASVESPPLRRRGRPPKQQVSAPEPESPTPEVPAEPGPEPAEAEPAAARQEAPTPSTGGRQGLLFNEKVATPQPEGPHAQIARKLAEAKISHEKFLHLLLDNELIDCERSEITMGEFDLGKVNPKILIQALRDWERVLEALEDEPK